MQKQIVNFSRALSCLALVALLILFAPTATADVFLPRTGQTFDNLEALRIARNASNQLILQSGDTIVLNGDDNSLTAPFGTHDLKFQGTGKISPSPGAAIRLFHQGASNFTFNSDSLEFSGFTNNTGHGGMFHGNGSGTISGGINTFTGNTTRDDGGVFVINGTIYISGGTNTFSANSAGTHGGALSGTINISGGTNTFSGNTAAGSGGAMVASGRPVSITGGTNTFTDNQARSAGGAICVDSTLLLRASNGDFMFQGNRDRVTNTSDPFSGKANAIYATNGNITLAARDGQNIYFYDPVTTGTASRTIGINPLTHANSSNPDAGRVVFDGGYWYEKDSTRVQDRHSAVYGTTTVGYGTMVLNGSAIYGVHATIGSFTLNDWATLESGAGTNEIRANTITMNGTVDIASGGTLALSAGSGVAFNGNLNIGLGVDSFGFVDVIGTSTFGNGATLGFYWDDDLTASESWKGEYVLSKFFSDNVSGFEDFTPDLSAFEQYDWVSARWNPTTGVLTVEQSAVPEPATLVVLGLGLAGLGWARRRKAR
ncbi:MAG: PEP-CTERM sorting domain-containing protein [Planctomycetaceae bacterium]|nr:PEP-CTERM sorting domain-containing protein [Planctomycetaceae bacterium]